MRVSGAMTMRLGRSRSPMRTEVKRGWTDMTALLDKGSSGDDDFAGLLARLAGAMGGRGGTLSRLTIMTWVSEPVKRWGLRAAAPGIAQRGAFYGPGGPVAAEPKVRFSPHRL